MENDIWSDLFQKMVNEKWYKWKYQKCFGLVSI